MKTKNKLFALLLALAMIVTYMPALAFAEGDEGAGADPVAESVQEGAGESNSSASNDITDNHDGEDYGLVKNKIDSDGTDEAAEVLEEETLMPESALADKDIADSDQLLWEFLDKELSEQTGEAEGTPKLRAKGRTAGSKLEGANSIIYNSLKTQIEEFVDPEETGESASSIFDVSAEEILGKELEQTQINTEAGLIDVYEISKADLEELTGCDGKTIIKALLSDLPYELYWFDKTEEYSYGLNQNRYYSNADYAYFEQLPAVRFTLKVAKAYSKTNQKGTTDFDTSKIDSVKTAVNDAASMIEAASEESDYGKLDSYRSGICSRTSYNLEAADDDSTPYGDPWQMIWVFDGDKNTNVVCEGYSKAFQYLCDHTEFEGNIECTSAVGTMEGGEGAGAHMWNTVTIGRKNYLADITNCDENTVGAPDQLFLAGWSEEIRNSEELIGYSYSCNEGEDNVDYIFNDGTFTEMSQDAYDPNEQSGGEDEESVEIEKLIMNGEEIGDGEDAKWAQFYSVDGKNGTKSLDDLNVVIKDENDKKVDSNDYDILVERTWWDEDQECTEKIQGTTYGIATVDQTDGAGFTEYRLTVSPKENSGYSGKISGSFYILDKYSLNYVCSNLSIGESSREDGWRMF